MGQIKMLHCQCGFLQLCLLVHFFKLKPTLGSNNAGCTFNKNESIFKCKYFPWAEKKKEQPSQINPKMQTSAVIQTSLPRENLNYFEVKGITLVAFDRQNSTTGIYIYARNLLGSLPGVGKRE